MFKIPAKILIVDDEKDFVEMFSLRLKNQGENVLVAYSGEEALEILGKTAVDVIFLDLRMPGMDGIDTLKQIKHLYPIVEVLLLTGHGSTETAVEGMKLGAFDYLMKPADFEDIKIKLENAKKRKEDHEERIRKAEAQLLVKTSRDI